VRHVQQLLGAEQRRLVVIPGILIGAIGSRLCRSRGSTSRTRRAGRAEHREGDQPAATSHRRPIAATTSAETIRNPDHPRHDREHVHRRRVDRLHPDVVVQDVDVLDVVRLWPQMSRSPMNIPSPSLYCGATIRMDQSGSQNAGTSSKRRQAQDQSGIRIAISIGSLSAFFIPFRTFLPSGQAGWGAVTGPRPRFETPPGISPPSVRFRRTPGRPGARSAACWSPFGETRT
jgi:hypothetical protein